METQAGFAFEGALLGQVCMEGQLGVDDPLVNKGASHLVFLMEEPSMKAYLRALLPRLLPQYETFAIEKRWDPSPNHSRNFQAFRQAEAEAVA